MVKGSVATHNMHPQTYMQKTAPARRKRIENETPLAKKRRARKINRELAVAYPNAVCELDFENPLQLLVATVLSAQCTDARVNQVTPALFAAYPEAADYGNARQEDVEELIHSTGFFRNKAANIIGLGKAIDEQHNGEVPPTLDELVKLPGVGRKTANVVLGNAFGVPGLTVDTHFGRLVRRLGLTDLEDPVAVEKEIAQQIEPQEWTAFSHRLIFHGRRVCHSRRAACGACFLAPLCPSFGLEGPSNPEDAEKLIKSDDKEWLLELAGLTDTEEKSVEKTGIAHE